MGRLSGQKSLTLAQQYLFLKNSPLAVGEGFINNAGLTWAYDVRPTPLSRLYTISIKLKRHGTPNVYVVKPDIEALAEGREIPHVYRKPLRLCLYLPSSGQWTPAKRLDQTIMPWTALWLFYFEEWLASGDWKGEGQHPDCTDDQNINRRQRRNRQ